MKRLFSFLLASLLILMFCSCKSPKAPLSADDNESDRISTSSAPQTEEKTEQAVSSRNDAPRSSKPTQNTNQSSSQKKTSSEAVKKITYEDIVCDETDFYKTVRLAAADSSTQLSMELPYNWSIKHSGDTCNILDDGKKIGRITCNDGAPQYSTNEFSTDATYSDIYITHNINRLSGTNSFIRVFSFTYENADGDSDTLVLTVNYEEIDSEAIVTMFESLHTAYLNSNNISGTLKIENASNQILILGNSFIGSSSIGSILQKMCGDDLTVVAVSRGYADVFTYTRDSYIMESIQSGDYGAVFMCGFYSVLCADEFQKIVTACESSNTKLAIFPAHNEGRDNILRAKAKFPYATLVDWQAEINSFIDSGHSETLFCVNDSHKHSTPLAGYIGAHMAYRAIFGKIPTQTSFNEVSISLIEGLGDYSKNGHIFDYNECTIIEN